MTKKLLLLSNSTNHGCEYLEHCRDIVINFFGRLLRDSGAPYGPMSRIYSVVNQRSNVTKILFVPYALKDYDGYAEKVRNTFKSFNAATSIESLHEAENPIEKIISAQGFFVGGGNTFLLLKTLYSLNLIEPIRMRVLEDGVPYMGTSAGTNIATINICTTNDMPIVHPPSLAALNLVPFNINPHYVDADPQSSHMGETREKRIEQYHEVAEIPVLGLRESSWLEIEGDTVILRGDANARVFLRGKSPQEVEVGSNLNVILCVSK